VMRHLRGGVAPLAVAHVGGELSRTVVHRHSARRLAFRGVFVPRPPRWWHCAGSARDRTEAPSLPQ
jgi:hypothetical protein